MCIVKYITKQLVEVYEGTKKFKTRQNDVKQRLHASVP